MSCSSPLTDRLTDMRAWTADTIGPPVSWVHTLSDTCLASLERLASNAGKEPWAIVDKQIYERDLEACRGCLDPVIEDLNRGRGFALVERLPVGRCALQELRAMYWGIGQLLGLPFEQDINGTLLYDVRDTGRDVRAGARFSVTNAESSFHTDNSFSPKVPDFVGLLCLRTARCGGRSQLISAYALHDELLAHHRDILETLYQPFHFDRRGEFKEGESPTFEAPLFHWDGEELSVRYLHYYMQVGHERAGCPLMPEQKKALDTIESMLRCDKFRVEFSLEPGQMLFTNNHWVLHNRTAFEDHADIECRRHYVRLWLSRSVS